CKEYKAWHNTILHDKFEMRTTTLATLSSAVIFPTSQQVISSTAHKLIADEFNNDHRAGASLDCESQTPFITEHIWERLGIEAQKTNLTIFGITNANSKVNKRCSIAIKSMHTKFKVPYTNSNLRHDIVNETEAKITIIDVTIPLENEPQAFTRARDLKREKYAGLAEDLSQGYETWVPWAPVARQMKLS
ncbi:hypothetical protein JTB14_000281, partial [Gonioctena quinquepunctata]